jgi:hypothetical protein
MKMSFIFIALGIGVVSGVIAALCGVGGGVVMVPAFTAWLGLTQKQAVATSLAVIIPTALSATVVNARGDLIQWSVVAVVAVSAVCFSYLAADWLKALSNEQLVRIFGVILVVMGVKMLWMGK